MAAVVGRVRVPQPCSPNAAGRHRCDTFDRFTYEDAVSHPAWCEGAKAINIPGEAGPGPQQEPGGAQGPGLDGFRECVSDLLDSNVTLLPCGLRERVYTDLLDSESDPSMTDSDSVTLCKHVTM
ncbi:Os09g0380501 [Oryza sativa Japonica Group]|uniref:Os09g0380501 protein n=1 Tax=Oryza sativa subsp. japonica TaxID=39947 RepID=A0A0P0XMV4_ORYSJ|nr:hypothetical protein EE612_047477 [Oryza sativa]BAT07848.1 Os09g0380501 [Oryza sativa Japonica Group]